MKSDLFINHITLHNYRIHKYCNYNISGKSVMISGDNGLGKTSIIEAISIFMPGKVGLIGNCMQDIVNRDAETQKCLIELGFNNFGASMEISGANKHLHRKISINNKHVSRNTEINKWFNVIWLTPALHYLLVSSTVPRRKLFDRISYYLEKNHLDNVNCYNKLVKDRMSLLLEKQDDHWISAVEKQLVEVTYKVTITRLELIKKICKISKNNSFKLVYDNSIEYQIRDMDIDQAKNFIAESFARNRKTDGIRHQTKFGPHRSQFEILYNEENAAIEQCSSGQQKIMIIDLIATLADIVHEVKESPPIILMDEIGSFLDKNNLEIAFNKLTECSSQFWATGTNKSALDKLDKCKIEHIDLNSK